MSKIAAIIKRSPVGELMRIKNRNSDATLYRVLADCLEIAEICQRDKSEFAALNEMIARLPLLPGNSRQYVEKGSDVYQRVCRLMFHGDRHTANTNRYAHCLREAARQGVNHKNLMRELANGGINKYFLVRPSQSQERFIATKCLRLDRQIRHLKSKVIRLRLKRNLDNSYEVLEGPD